jgi:tetratricopeptide (TPR) repeat protein
MGHARDGAVKRQSNNRRKSLHNNDLTNMTGAGQRFVPALRLFVLLGVSFVLKLIVLLQLKEHPLASPDAGLDTTAYVELARRVLAGDIALGPGLYYVSPLYIYFLASVLAVFDSFTVVRGVQIALGTASVGFIFLTARAWFGERAAWIAAGLAVFTGLFTFYEVLILQSSLDAFLTSAALWCLTDAVTFRLKGKATVKPVASGFSRKILLAGVIFGIETLNRPNILIAAIGVAAVMLFITRRVRMPTLLVTGLLLGMAPAAIRNVVVSRQFSFVSSHGGLNFYIGNSERATGFYTNVPGITPTIVGQERDARRVAERALGRPVTDAETSAYFFDLGWSWITSHPAQAAALFAKKVYFVFNAAHTPLPHSYPFYAYDSGTILRFLFVGPWLLIPLGVAGLLLVPSAGDRRGYLVFASFVPAYAAAVALFFVAERYRLPLLVPLCVGAGGLLASLWTAASARVARPDWRGLAAAVIAFAVAANWPLHLDDGRWEEGLRLAQRYVILRDYDAADRWVDRLEASPSPRAGAAHYGVGVQLLLGNEPERARQHLELAYRAQPSNARIEYAFGQALLKTGRAADAIPHLRRGFESGEDIPAGGYDLAEALYATGDLRGAAAVVQRVRLSDSEDIESWLRLGRIAQQGREPAIAEPFFRHAVELRPDLGSARQQYGLNLVVLGRVEQAERELREAVRLDPRDSDSLSGLAYCEMQLGRTEDARAHAAAALAINPADPLAGGILRRGGS